VVFRESFAPDTIAQPPPGWREAATTDYTVTWVRDEPLPTAGGVAWSSPGVEVEATQNDDRTLRLRVENVPPGGGTVVLSRLAWPGYHVEGARLAEPLADQLLTVHVAAGSSDQEIQVRYSPPGWLFGLTCWFVGVGLGVLAALLHPLLRRRDRRPRVSAGS
jgi:hypothetical protein